MKFVLTLLMCTSVGNQCLPPYQNPTIYDDAYDCMVDGYTKRLQMALNQEKLKVRTKVFTQTVLS
jgi:hypothetical protein